MINSIIQALFIKIQFNMSNQQKKRQRIYDLLNAETKPNFLYPILSKENVFIRKSTFSGKGGAKDQTNYEKKTFYMLSRRWLNPFEGMLIQ